MLTRGRWPITSQPVFEPPLDRSVRLFWPSFLIIHPQTLKLPAEDIMLITLIHQGDHENVHPFSRCARRVTHSQRNFEFRNSEIGVKAHLPKDKRGGKFDLRDQSS